MFTTSPEAALKAQSGVPSQGLSGGTRRSPSRRVVATAIACHSGGRRPPGLVSSVMQVGSLHILPVYDGVAEMPTEELLRFTGPRDDPFAMHQQFLTPDGRIELAMGGFLVRTGDHVVLIDAGIGTVVTPPFRGGHLLESLGELGLTAADITDVCFTHLHFDHVGWATQKGKVVFENATYRCHRADWQHFVDGDDPGAARKLAPIADRIEFWEKDVTLFPGLDVTGAPGHTPGSTIFVVSDGGEQAMLLGDVVHCPIELIEDDWEAIVDVDPVLARRTRESLAREIEGKDVPLAASHFPGLQFGRLLPGEGTRSWRY